MGFLKKVAGSVFKVVTNPLGPLVGQAQGGGSGVAGAPGIPDYAKLAELQARLDQEAADKQTMANRPNQIGPGGSSISWTKDPVTGQWTQKETLDPATKAAYDQAQALQTKTMGALANQGAYAPPTLSPYDPNLGKAEYQNLAGQAGIMDQLYQSQLDAATRTPTYDLSSGREVSDALYGSIMDRARPEMEAKEAMFATQLRQKGLQPGTVAYDRAMQNLLTSHGDVVTQAGQQATLAGYDEALKRYMAELQGQGQAFGQVMGAQGQGFNQRMGALEGANANTRAENAARAAHQDQAYAQYQSDYQMPWDMAKRAQEMASGSFRPQYQSFMSGTGYAPADMVGAAQSGYNARMGQYNAGQQKKQNMLNAGATVGGAALSDETLKEDITPIEGQEALAAVLALNGYTFRWKETGEMDAGVLAQEVQKALPYLVQQLENGKLAVHYTQIVALLIEAVKYLANRSQLDA